MTKNELIGCIAEKTGLAKKDSESALNAIVDSITAALVEDDKVQLTGFGAFEVKERPEHTGRNPQTKESIVIPASRSVVFKAGKVLKDSVNA